MINFPNFPTVGQIFPPYVWDGARWLPSALANSLGYGDPPEDTNPLMNGVLMPGLTYKYSRGDHVHPSDTSRALTANASLTGTTTTPAATINGSTSIAGKLFVVGDGSQLGVPSGAGQPAALDISDANIIIYEYAVNNWAGIGTDVNGRWWMRTGISGTPAAAFYIDQSRNATFLKTPYAPTPPSSDNSNKFATTAFVAANPASGPYVPLSGGSMSGMLTVANADLRTHRGDRTGVVFLNNTGDRYLYYNGSGYHLPGAHANSANGRLWGNGDFPSPIVNIRLAFLADYSMGTNRTLHEPWGGGIITGTSGHNLGYVMRWRQFQIQIGSTWYAVGYV